METNRTINSIQGRKKFGRRLCLVGLIILCIGLVASFVPNFYPPGTEAPNEFAKFLQQYWSYVSFVSLLAGFIFASVGSYYFISAIIKRKRNR